MNVFQRQMFANGDEVKFTGNRNDPILVKRDDGTSYYISPNPLLKNIGKPPSLTKKDPSSFKSGIDVVANTGIRDTNVAKDQMIPDALVDDFFEEINQVLLPNEIRLNNGEKIDFTDGIKKIQSGAAGGGMDIYPILNAERDGSIELGANVRAALRSFADRDMPTLYKGLGLPEQGIYTDFGTAARTGILGLKEMGREALENFIPIFGGEASIDNLGIRADYKGGDPRGFALRGGRSREELDDLITGLSGQTQAEVAQNMLSDAPSKQAPGSDNIDEELEKINEIDLENLPKPKEAGDTAKMVRETEPETEPKGEREEEITSEEAPRRNFAEFARSPDFIRFARNVGKGLVTTGEIGKGLAIGAAGAAEEKEAERQSERDAEIAREAANAGITKDIFMEQFKSKEEFLNKQNDYSTALSKTVFEVETSDAVLGALNEAERLVKTGDVTGLSPLFQEYFNKALRQFGQDVPLSAREAAKNILEDIKNGEIKAILGESGRTISNLDRQIAGNLIGAIDFKADKENVLDKISKARRRARDRYTNAESNYQAALQPYARFGVQAPFKIGTPMVKSVDESGERIRLYIKP